MSELKLLAVIGKKSLYPCFPEFLRLTFNHVFKKLMSNELSVYSDSIGIVIKFKKDFVLINPENGELYNWVCNGHPCVIYTNMEVSEGSLIRTKDENYVEGKFRDSGR